MNRKIKYVISLISIFALNACSLPKNNSISSNSTEKKTEKEDDTIFNYQLKVGKFNGRFSTVFRGTNGDFSYRPIICNVSDDKNFVTLNFDHNGNIINKDYAIISDMVGGYSIANKSKEGGQILVSNDGKKTKSLDFIAPGETILSYDEDETGPTIWTINPWEDSEAKFIAYDLNGNIKMRFGTSESPFNGEHNNEVIKDNLINPNYTGDSIFYYMGDSFYSFAIYPNKEYDIQESNYTRYIIDIKNSKVFKFSSQYVIYENGYFASYIHDDNPKVDYCTIYDKNMNIKWRSREAYLQKILPNDILLLTFPNEEKKNGFYNMNNELLMEYQGDEINPTFNSEGLAVLSEGSLADNNLGWYLIDENLNVVQNYNKGYAQSIKNTPFIYSTDLDGNHQFFSLIKSGKYDYLPLIQSALQEKFNEFLVYAYNVRKLTDNEYLVPCGYVLNEDNTDYKAILKVDIKSKNVKCLIKNILSENEEIYIESGQCILP